MNISEELRQKIDLKTKPLGALGRLEELALRIGTIQNTLTPELKNPHIIVFAGDHGIAREGTSAYPQEVTYQMVMNFLNKGAAINVFCKQNNIRLKIADAGVNFDFESTENLIHSKAGHGTQSFLNGEAMTSGQLAFCFDQAGQIVERIFQTGCNIIGFGEMGIGNTSSAAMLMSYLCNLPIEDCAGRGTGVDDTQFAHKISVLKKTAQFHGIIEDPRLVLQTFGGFEIAQMCGAMLAAQKRNMIIMVDGFIATGAFLVAQKMNPQIAENAIFCHLSDEAGHQTLLQHLGAVPLLRLGMRLGEGTGCAVAYPVIKSAVEFLNKMACFEQAGVSNKE